MVATTVARLHWKNLTIGLDSKEYKMNIKFWMYAITFFSIYVVCVLVLPINITTLIHYIIAGMCIGSLIETVSRKLSRTNKYKTTQ